MICELTENTNICNIDSCIINVEGKPSNSKSPTDIWILSFERNTTYNGINLETAMLKLFANLESINSEADDEETYLKMFDSLSGLNYEMKVYKEITNPLLNYNICPNFVRCLATQEGCTYENIFNFLRNNTTYGTSNILGRYSNNKFHLDDDEVKNILNKNIKECLLDFCTSRESINTKLETSGSISSPPNLSITYNMILNENMDIPNVSKYETWMERNTLSEKDLWETIFQIVTACYAMSLSKMVHNDLHLNNIFVKDLGKEVPNIYVVNGNFYVISSRWKIFIYDFDRSYVERFDKNPFIDTEACLKYSQCNYYTENKDVFKVLCRIVNKVKTENKFRSFTKTLLMCLANTEDEIREIYQVLFEKDKCKFQDIKELDSYLKRFNSNETIVENIGNHLPDISKVIEIPNENFYICGSAFFNKENGEIDPTKYDNITNEIVEIYANNTIFDILELRKNKFQSKWKWSEASREGAREAPREGPREAPDEFIRTPCKKPCPPEKICNEKYGTCVLRSGRRGQSILKGTYYNAKSDSTDAQQPLKGCNDPSKPCPSDKICNKDTGICVKPDGKVGKSILEGTYYTKKTTKEAAKEKKIPCIPACPPEKICNDESGKCVKRDGRIGRKLTSMPTETYESDAKNPLSTDKNMIIKGDCNRPCLVTEICTPKSNRCIKANGEAAKKLIEEYQKLYPDKQLIFPLGRMTEKGETSSSGSKKFKVMKTLENGNCFYSAIYRSAKNNNLLEKLFRCIHELRADTETTFIKKFREYVSINIPDKIIENLFYTLMELYQDDEDSFDIAVNKIGYIKEVVKEYAKNEMLVPEYLEGFISDIKKAIKKDKKYVGEIEVTFIKEILQSCDLYIKIFNSNDSAIEEIQTDSISNVLYNDTLYLINRGELHYVYLVEDA